MAYIPTLFIISLVLRLSSTERTDGSSFALDVDLQEDQWRTARSQKEYEHQREEFENFTGCSNCFLQPSLDENDGEIPSLALQWKLASKLQYAFLHGFNVHKLAGTASGSLSLGLSGAQAPEPFRIFKEGAGEYDGAHCTHVGDLNTHEQLGWNCTHDWANCTRVENYSSEFAPLHESIRGWDNLLEFISGQLVRVPGRLYGLDKSLDHSKVGSKAMAQYFKSLRKDLESSGWTEALKDPATTFELTYRHLRTPPITLWDSWRNKRKLLLDSDLMETCWSFSADFLDALTGLPACGQEVDKKSSQLISAFFGRFGTHATSQVSMIVESETTLKVQKAADLPGEDAAPLEGLPEKQICTDPKMDWMHPSPTGVFLGPWSRFLYLLSDKNRWTLHMSEYHGRGLGHIDLGATSDIYKNLVCAETWWKNQPDDVTSAASPTQPQQGGSQPGDVLPSVGPARPQQGNQTSGARSPASPTRLQQNTTQHNAAGFKRLSSALCILSVVLLSLTVLVQES